LKRERLARRLPTTGVEGASQKTVQKIEKGTPGEVDTLSAYAKGLGVDLVDVFTEALPTPVQVLNREARDVLRAYDETADDAEWRNLLVSLARRILRERDTRTSDQ
jgi:transcriptional regulator with XRE-family HTH domain